ncbi:uncharacterized protein N7484_005600 [Penicillium longicatenatum]|uniref:uncharacterized protein n=1 Tax=Penicillium longicatenatum TaxID=1561947 RepID=UPI002547B53E|nr:uncharacterized protein N7484_005600 [Penicillium longicatenatum]KAJ5643093.1 hypothetical protein N7484_005600 [Penicillium longicatenatum]
MSVNDQPPSVDVTISLRASQPAADLQSLDQRLKHLSDDVLPPHPYLLTLPTKVPFRLGPRSANNWAVGHDRPFTPEEQELQYMTFLTHSDTDSLLKAVGDWSDEKGRMMADRSTAPTTAETPKDNIARKKISLNDYKNQKNSSPSPAVHDQKNREGRYPATREEVQQTPKTGLVKKSDKAEPPHYPPKSQSQVSLEKGPKKRPSTSDLETVSSSATRGQDMHSFKKRRLSPEKEVRRDPTPTKSNSPRLPALLSPTLPPTGPKLPRLLSPTLPPDVEKELARLGDRSPPRHSPKRDTITSKLKRDEAAQTRTPNSTNSGTFSSLQNGRMGVLPKETNQEMIVRLRYGKGNKKRIEALLKFSGKRKSNRPESPSRHGIDPDETPVEKKKKGESGSTRGNGSSDRLKPKSKHEEELSSSGVSRSKEPKCSVEKLPTPPLNPSRHLPVNDKVKPMLLTPVKDAKASLPRRNDLGEGEGRTPVNPTTKRHSIDPGTRGSPSQLDGRSRNTDRDRRAWRDEFQRFTNIGRELKHAAVRYNAKPDSSSADEKLAAVTAIEAIMGFIVAFVADDQCKVHTRQVGDSSTWQSILAYWQVVRKNSTSYPVLHGLCLLLGAVSYGAIHSLDLERLAVSPLPGEHTPVPTPGSDGNTVLSDENKKSRKEFLELKNRLPECWKESQKLWLEGTRSLSEDVLSTEFPNTWSLRSHNHGERGKATPRPGDYAGDYFLPLGGTTSPIEVVRFGWSLLQEWCTHEKVEWNGRLGL